MIVVFLVLSYGFSGVFSTGLETLMLEFDLKREKEKNSPYIYKYTADLLRIMKKYHSEGLVMGFNAYWSRYKLSLNSEGNVEVVYCDPRPFSLSSIIDLAPKDDLANIGEFFTLKGSTRLYRSEVDQKVLGFIEDVERTRRDQVFDYDRWIDHFSQPDVIPFIDPVWPVNEEIRTFCKLRTECIERSFALECSLGAEKFEDECSEEACPRESGTQLFLEDGEQVEFVDRKSCKSGTTAVACRSRNDRYFLKCGSIDTTNSSKLT